MTKEELYDILTCDESYRIERTVSTGNMDKFQEAIYLGKDHLGNNRVVIDANHYVSQTNNYYPFGATWNESSSSTNNQTHKYNGKELDRMHGLDFYDYGARNYDAALGMFTSMDPLCEKYYHISPYAYCGGNPVSRVDINGDSITILNLGGVIGHSAMLIQNADNRWAYYSMNGIKFYKLTNGEVGGKSENDYGIKTFESPEEFLNSQYNNVGKNSKDVDDDKVNNYGYIEAYVIPTTKEQDKKAANYFKNNAKNGQYNLITNNCAQMISKTLEHIGINTHLDIYDTSIRMYRKDYPILPASLFRNIRINYPHQKYIKK